MKPKTLFLIILFTLVGIFVYSLIETFPELKTTSESYEYGYIVGHRTGRLIIKMIPILLPTLFVVFITSKIKKRNIDRT